MQMTSSADTTIIIINIKGRALKDEVKMAGSVIDKERIVTSSVISIAVHFQSWGKRYICI